MKIITTWSTAANTDEAAHMAYSPLKSELGGHLIC